MISGHSKIASEISTAMWGASPPVAVATATFAGLSLQSWVYVATIVYAVLQSAYLIFKWVRDWRRK